MRSTQGTPSEKQTYTIGKLAKRANTTAETLRFYEKQGLLPEPHRSASGYRLYNDQALQRIHFIQQAKAAGFSLGEIHELLDLVQTPGAGCIEVKSRTQNKIATINEKIAALTHIRETLVQLERSCSGVGDIKECRILESLSLFDNSN